MTQVRLTVERFANDVEGALAALGPNDEVVLERGGKVIARVKPEPVQTDWKAFAEDLKKIPPLDEQFERDILEIVRERNRPVEASRWEP